MATYYTDEDEILTLDLADLSVGDAATDDVTSAQVLSACLDAYNLINAKVGLRYSVPFSTASPPAIIEQISDRLVRYIVWSYGAGRSVSAKGAVKNDYDEALKMLDDIAAGKLKVIGASRKVALESSTRDEHPVFASVDTLDLGQDADQSDRLSDERD